MLLSGYGRRTRLSLAVLVALVLLITMPATSCAPDGSEPAAASAERAPVWSAGFEGGNLDEWTSGRGGGAENSGTGAVAASADVAHGGRYSAKLSITGASNQSQAARLFRWKESAVNPQAYYNAWYYFPQQYSGMIWWNVFQFKSKLSENANDPLWVLNVGNRGDGQMYFYLYDWMNRRSYTQYVRSIPVGTWFQLEAYYQQSVDGNGRVTFWQDGQQILDLTGLVTKRQGDEINWSITNYTDNIYPPDVTIYVDDTSITTERLGGAGNGPSTQSPASPPQQSRGVPQFVLGFKVLAEFLGSMVGRPVEDEYVSEAGGDTMQHTTTGLMVWRKADGVLAFTDGARTWLKGPLGVEVRPNGQRLPWEK